MPSAYETAWSLLASHGRTTIPVEVSRVDGRKQTSHHFGQCEYVSETDPAVIKILLKVTDKGDYDWVECGSCDAGWQVAHFESVE